MLTATSGPVSTAAETVGLVVAVLGLIAVCALVVAYFFARRGQATTALQADTIAALEAANSEKQERISRLEGIVADLQEQVQVLRELVTQTAKVDLLRDEVAAGFKTIIERMP